MDAVEIHDIMNFDLLSSQSKKNSLLSREDYIREFKL